MRIFFYIIIQVIVTQSSYSFNCGIHLTFKKPEIELSNEQNKAYEKFLNKIKKSDSKGLKESEKRLVKKIFKNLESDLAKKLTDEWIFKKERSDIDFFGWMIYVFKNQRNPIDERKMFFDLIDSLDSHDENLWINFSLLLNNGRGSLNKTIYFLLVLNRDFKTQKVSSYALSKFLGPLQENIKNFSFGNAKQNGQWILKAKMIKESHPQLHEMIRLNPVQVFLFGGYGIRYTRVARLKRFEKSILEMFEEVKKRVTDLWKVDREIETLDPKKKNQLGLSLEIKKEFNKIKNDYDTDFLKLMKEIYGENDQALYEILISAHTSGKKSKDIYSQINWNTKSIKRVLNERHLAYSDSAQVAILLIENISRFGKTKNYRSLSPREVSEKVGEIFYYLGQFSKKNDPHGINFLIKQLGSIPIAKNPENIKGGKEVYKEDSLNAISTLRSDLLKNEKFKGALFTYEYFKTSVDNGLTSLVGFEVPMYVVSSFKKRGEAYVSFLERTDNGTFFNKINYQTRKKMENYKIEGKFPKKGDCIEIVKKIMVNLGKCSKIVGRVVGRDIFKIERTRESDFVINERGQYIFNEMKNYGSFQQVHDQVREFSFDVFFNSATSNRLLKKNKPIVNWVVHQRSIGQGQESKYFKKLEKNLLEFYFSRKTSLDEISIEKAEFWVKLRNMFSFVGKKKLDLSIQKTISDISNVEFFEPQGMDAH